MSYAVLPAQLIQTMMDERSICADRPILSDQIQPASLDLRLGARAYRVRASFLPGSHARVQDIIADHTLHEIDLRQGAVLETGCVYIVPLLEQLALKDIHSARANPKSSTGRLDIFTRLITDGAARFDTINPGYEGPLYAEISPRTFPILMREGSRLIQIRFRQKIGQERRAGDAPSPLKELPALETARQEHQLSISIDLEGSWEKQKGGESIIGYRAKRHTAIIDIDAVGKLATTDYWEPIYAASNDRFILDPNEFYILASCESVSVPPDFAAEMVAIDPLMGEFRIHYAGFFDPGFGIADNGRAGARAVLEMRSHDVPFILEHGQTIGQLDFQPMLMPPDFLYGQHQGSHYQGQGLKLSKHFKI